MSYLDQETCVSGPSFADLSAVMELRRFLQAEASGAQSVGTPADLDDYEGLGSCPGENFFLSVLHAPEFVPQFAKSGIKENQYDVPCEQVGNEQLEADDDDESRGDDSLPSYPSKPKQKVKAFFDPTVSADRDIVLRTVSQDGRALDFAAENLRSDRQTVLKAIAKHRPALRHAAKHLRNDPDFVLEAAARNGMLLSRPQVSSASPTQISAPALPNAQISSEEVLEPLLKNWYSEHLGELRTVFKRSADESSVSTEVALDVSFGSGHGVCVLRGCSIFLQVVLSTSCMFWLKLQPKKSDPHNGPIVWRSEDKAASFESDNWFKMDTRTMSAV